MNTWFAAAADPRIAVAVALIGVQVSHIDSHALQPSIETSTHYLMIFHTMNILGLNISV
jgi:hypothetical protein